MQSATQGLGTTFAMAASSCASPALSLPIRIAATGWPTGSAISASWLSRWGACPDDGIYYFCQHGHAACLLRGWGRRRVTSGSLPQLGERCDYRITLPGLVSVEVALAQKDVDPAALLIAVFVAITGEVLSPGGWTFPDTIVAGVVLVIVLAFSSPAVRQLDKFQLIALSLVIGAIVAVAVSWPVQKFYVIPHWYDGKIQHGADRNADRAGYIGFLAGFVVAVVYATKYWPRKAHTGSGC